MGGGGIQWLLIEGPENYFISEDGNTAEGSAEQDSPDITIKAQWSLRRSRE